MAEPVPVGTLARDFVKELQAALKGLGTKLEGFRQLSRTQVDDPAAADAIRTAVALRDRRKIRLDTALAATIALLDDDYPKMPRFTVPQNVYKDIKENLAEQEAAFEDFASEKPPEPPAPPVAESLNPSLGTPVPRVKP